MLQTKKNLTQRDWDDLPSPTRNFIALWSQRTGREYTYKDYRGYDCLSSLISPI